VTAASYRYQWLRDNKKINHATKATYRLTGKDRHHRIRVRITGRRPGFVTGTALSASRGPVR
jgi:TolB-like protein